MAPQGRKVGRRAARRAAQLERCGADTTSCRQCKERPQSTEAPASSTKLPARAAPSELSPALRPSSPPAVDSDSSVERTRRRSVSFDLQAGTQHEITPYAEVYGFHPNEFLFDRDDFVLLLADEELGCYSMNRNEDAEEGADEEEDEDETPMEDAWVVVHSG